ncbi:phosphonate C-P lyase system protein PhnL [Geitlerinema sp. PCC 9228]|uniref:phosphonate C-P lyase system protein PhnL n=1 Tax=Geitlerinema sp. PCC 9228 TaxID=111611 RepID=UPI0008F9DA60|nr:phosphonate C-P lyase system protein PhnL [Geitlerinema sp. PCC 9228]
MVSESFHIATHQKNSPDETATFLLQARHLYKSFILHNQGGVELPVLQGVSLTVYPGECVALSGVSGSGKSTFMRSLYGNYGLDGGAIWVKHEGKWVNLPQLLPHELMEIRRKTIGYVSQFLRVIPRVPAIEVAAEPLLELGEQPEQAYQKVKEWFARFQLPERLWHLSPTTFSGGEQQRVNVARAFAVNYPIFLLDEPTSALDAANRQVIIDSIQEKKSQGCAIIGIFHDQDVRSQVCNCELVFER